MKLKSVRGWEKVMPVDTKNRDEIPEQEASEYEALEAALQIAQRDVRAAMLRFAKAVEEKNEHSEHEVGHTGGP
jgi:hypothetical protein